MVDQGIPFYPGIEACESFTFTDLSGISPATAVLDVYPQQGLPDLEGTLSLTYGPYEINILGCRVDSANYVRNSGGSIVQVSIFDERWRWQYYDISGRYNFKFVKAFYPESDAEFFGEAAVGLVDPAHEKKPQDLAILCVEAMGYSVDQWDVSALPNDARPEINWVAANPAQELDRLCHSFGCRIVPVRSTGSWRIVLTGEGNTLDDLPYPYQDPATGIDPAEWPDWIKIVTAPYLYEARIQLKAVGKDIDGRWRDIGDLTYTQGNGVVINLAGLEVNDGIPLGTADDPLLYLDPKFSRLSRTRIKQTDNTLISPLELATQTIFRTYVMDEDPDNAGQDQDGNPTIQIRGIDGGVDVRQIVLTDKLVRPYIDPDDNTVHYRMAFVEGTFWNKFVQGPNNWPLGTRIDRPAPRFGQGTDQFVTFNLHLDEDSRFSLISFSEQMTRHKIGPPPQGAAGANVDFYTAAADLYYHAAVNIRNDETWALERATFSRWVGTGDIPDGATADDVGALTKTILKTDLQPFYRGDYDTNGNLTRTIDNIDAVEIQAEYYIDGIVNTLETKENATRNFIGLYGIDLDGQIQQVTYKIDKSGATTTASMNTEHDWQIPTWEQRRQRDARQNPENKQEVAKELEINLRQGGHFPQ